MLKKMRKFLENTSGSILPTMGILIIPLGIVAGAAVDYTRYVNMRNEVQIGIDAAAIATINELPDILSSIPQDLEGDEFDERANIELRKYAGGFLEANIVSTLGKESYEFEVNYSSGVAGQNNFFQITANIEYDTIFGGINGEDGGLLLYKDSISDVLTSIVNTGNRTIEVALVMDNSGSMGNPPTGGGDRKVDSMKIAANKLVADLYRSAVGAQLVNPVQFSLVPFSATVNIGPTGHDNLDGDFMDQRGINPANNENLDWENTFRTTENIDVDRHVVSVDDQPVTRMDVFDMIGEPWAGCVEMRPWPHNVLDTVVQAGELGFNSINNSLDGDGDGVNDGARALFVPYFAPDEPDEEQAEYWGPNGHASRNREYATGVDHNDDDDRYRNSYLYDFRDYNLNNPDNHIQLYTNDNAEIVDAANNGDLDNDGIRDPDGTGNGSIQNIANGQRGSTNQINRTNWMFKYQSNVQLGTLSSTFGPNDGCRTDPITALTPDETTVQNAIASMSASGTTNIQQGLTWGWRSLSEALPFDQGRPSDDPVNLKFIILLTDGNNFYGTDGDSTPNISEYGAWGYMRPDTHPLRHAVSGEATHNRIAEGVDPEDLIGTIYEGQNFDLTPDNQGEFRALMNVHTAQACENVKADGVSIYTIVYDLNDQNTIDLMRACSGSGIIDENEVIRNVQFFHQAEGQDLSDTFAEISSSISAIRLTQ